MTWRCGVRWLGLAMAVLACSAATEVSALTDEEIYRDLRFNLVNPGARSLALGGAFVSLADDATAAAANPAGLSYLRRNEYFFEVRAVDFEAVSTVTQESLPADIDTFVATGSDLSDTVSPSFLSVVIPFTKQKTGWTLGVSRQELVKLENSTISGFAFTFAEPGVVLVDGTGFIDVEVVNYNVSGGLRVGDRFAFGANIGLSLLDLRSEVNNFIVDTNANLTECEILERTLALTTSSNDSDTDYTFGLGMTYRANENLGMGVVFKRNPRFAVPLQIVPGTDPCLPDGDAEQIANTFELPDSLGAGGHWRPTDRLMWTFDVEYIWYSNLLNGYVAGLNVLTGSDAVFTVDDGIDIRTGVEYIFFTNKGLPLALRGGVFRESDSTIRAESTGTESFATEEVFSGRGSQMHGTIGLGVNWPRIKVDMAADFAESDNEYVVSVIFQGK
jgi:long-subunit fatty acid transport protein